MGTSWDPEKRAEQEITGFVQDVQAVFDRLKGYAKTDAQKALLYDEMQKFQAGYAEKYNEKLASHGRTISSFITGASKFPTRKAEKANLSYDKKLQDMLDWKDRAEKAIIRKLKGEAIEEEGGEIAHLQKKLENAEKLQQMMVEANKIIRKKQEPGIEGASKNKQLVNLGFTEQQASELLKPDFAGRVGFSYHPQNNNQEIHRLKDRIAQLQRKEVTGTREFAFSGGHILDNQEDDRVQIFFDQKPAQDIINKLKGEGWHWSPSIGAWQRKRTEYALMSANRITGAQVETQFSQPEVITGTENWFDKDISKVQLWSESGTMMGLIPKEEAINLVKSGRYKVVNGVAITPLPGSGEIRRNPRDLIGSPPNAIMKMRLEQLWKDLLGAEDVGDFETFMKESSDLTYEEAREKLLRTYGKPERLHVKNVKDIEESFHAQMCDSAAEDCRKGDAEACRVACQDCGIEEFCPPGLAQKKTAPEDEYYAFGTKVLVSAGDDPELEPAFRGTVIRVLNDGKLIEVIPEGQTQGSFRIDANRVIVDRLQPEPEKKPEQKVELKPASSWRKFPDHKSETKTVKEALKKAGIEAEVSHGRGTGWGWLEINIGDPKTRSGLKQPPFEYQYTDEEIALQNKVLKIAQEVTGRHGEYDGEISILAQEWRHKPAAMPPAKHAPIIIPEIKPAADVKPKPPVETVHWPEISKLVDAKPVVHAFKPVEHADKQDSKLAQKLADLTGVPVALPLIKKKQHGAPGILIGGVPASIKKSHKDPGKKSTSTVIKKIPRSGIVRLTEEDMQGTIVLKW